MQFLDQVVVPVIAQCQVRSVCCMSSTSLSWRRCRFQWFSTEIPQLQHIDKVIDVCCAGPADSLLSVRRQSRSHSCSPFLLDQGPLCSTTGAGCRSAENCDGPAVAAHSTRLSMSLLAQFIDKFWTSCDLAATFVQWKCLRFSYRR